MRFVFPLLVFLAACEPMSGLPDAHGPPSDGATGFDGSSCLGGHCFVDMFAEASLDGGIDADLGDLGDLADRDARTGSTSARYEPV